VNSSDRLAARHIGGYTLSIIKEKWTGLLHGGLIRILHLMRRTYLGLGSAISYSFTVDVTNGIVKHPNLVRFRVTSQNPARFARFSDSPG
jgi:hypothetical protein